MSDTPHSGDQEREHEGEERAERGLPKTSTPLPPASGGTTEPQPPDSGAMSPDQDVIGSG